MLLYYYHPNYHMSSLSALVLKKMFHLYYSIELEIKSTEILNLFEQEIFNSKPEIVIVHCHDHDRNFEVIRELTKRIKEELKSLIFVDYNWQTDEKYYKENMHGYFSDLLIKSSNGAIYFLKETPEMELIEKFITEYKNYL